MSHIPVSRRAASSQPGRPRYGPRRGDPQPRGRRASMAGEATGPLAVALRMANAVRSFRSHIRSASFLLRQQDLPTTQAAGTHVFVTQCLPLKRAAVNHRFNSFGSWADGRNPCESRTAALGRSPRAAARPLTPISHLS